MKIEHQPKVVYRDRYAAPGGKVEINRVAYDYRDVPREQHSQHHGAFALRYQEMSK